MDPPDLEEQDDNVGIADQFRAKREFTYRDLNYGPHSFIACYVRKTFWFGKGTQRLLSNCYLFYVSKIRPKMN